MTDDYLTPEQRLAERDDLETERRGALAQLQGSAGKGFKLAFEGRRNH